MTFFYVVARESWLAEQPDEMILPEILPVAWSDRCGILFIAGIIARIDIGNAKGPCP